MSSNQTPENPKLTSYPSPYYERSLTSHSNEMAPFPTATPYNIWNSGLVWHDPEVPPITGMDWYDPEESLMTCLYSINGDSEANYPYQAAPIQTAMNSSNLNSETNRHYQPAQIQTGMPCSTCNSETNCHYHVASIPSVMPRSTSDPELTMQRVSWSECQTQMMIDRVNSQNGVNFGPNPATTLSVDDEFMMYHFKVEKCSINRGHHDWTDCQYLHTGEKARRRDPRKYLYSGKPCADFRKRGQCENRDRCHFAHGVFEIWLHPDNYRTQMCRDLAKCQRKVCFFAHSANELREGDGVKEDISFDLSPKSVLSMDQSPPESPTKFLNNDAIRVRKTNSDTIRGMEMNNDTISGMEINNDTIRGIDNLQSNTAPKGFQNFANGAGYIVRTAIGRRNSNCSSEEIDFLDFPHIIWIIAILDN